MKKTWKKLLAAICTLSLLMTASGMSVLADNVVATSEAEIPAQDVPEEIVGAGAIQVGDGVTATFDANTGAVKFTSSDGELWPDWVDKLGVGRDAIKSIKVASGTVYLPGGYSTDRLFSGLSSLENLDMSNINTSNVINMKEMFDGCSSLKYLDLSGFDTSNVMFMSFMFSGCSSLTYLNLTGFDTSKVLDMISMFSGCSSLTKLDLSSFNTSNVTDMNEMFYNCSSLTNLDLSNFNTSYVTDMCGMFSKCSNLLKLDLSNFSTSNVTNMNGMFEECSNLTELYLSSFNTSNVTEMNGMFLKCSSLTNLDLSSFNTSNVVDMWGMFYQCSNLISVNLSGFKTSNVMDMTCMFYDCNSLRNLDLSSFNTSNVTDMGAMFYGCSSLTSLDLSSFNTSNVMDMYGMFMECSSLTNLDLSSFNTSNVMYMSFMFVDCSSLTNLDLSGFDISNEMSVSEMFRGCSSLEILKTPKKNSISIELPVTMYDESGNAYKALPVLSKSIILTREITDIFDCTVSLSSTNYTYDGRAKEPTVTVKDGGVVLTFGTDYTVSYTNNTSAGTATVKVIGTGDYKGEQSVTFTINKANAKLAFAESALTKKTTDAAFTNALTMTTDGAVKFTSSNTKVAVVDSSSGLVTIKGSGTVTITANALQGQNYKAGSAAYTLTITEFLPQPEPVLIGGFSDVKDPTHPYYKAIYWAADAGITKGYSDGTFGVNKSCTRGEMIMFLWRYSGKPAPRTVSKSPFKDVAKTHAFYKAILWASQKGITKGYPDGTFGINRNVSRGECMMFLWRVKNKPAPKAVSKSPFKDVATTNAFYKAILWGYQKKITTGYTSGAKKGTFGINENCTRGQIVTFLYRAK